MDRLEKIMKENKELFLDQEPSLGHFERFEQKLSKQNNRSKVIRLSRRISKIAAIGLLALMSSMWAYNEFVKPKEKVLSLGDMSQQYSEVEFYFTSQIDSKYDDITRNEVLIDSDYNEFFNLELERMDSIYLNLQKELGANPHDERVIEAMISYYYTKLKVMNKIVDQLTRIQEENQSHNNNQNQYESVKL